MPIDGVEGAVMGGRRSGVIDLEGRAAELGPDAEAAARRLEEEDLVPREGRGIPRVGLTRVADFVAGDECVASAEAAVVEEVRDTAGEVASGEDGELALPILVRLLDEGLIGIEEL